MTARCGIVVFAKAPRPGRVKTRLIPALGAAGAAALARRFLAETLGQALAADVGPVALCVAGGARDAWVRALARDAGVALWPQGRGGLGTRMAVALTRMRTEAGAPALLIGTDAPALEAGRLRRAAHALARADAVFVPTVDGGYALVGLAGDAPQLFSGMRWSHAGVMADTRARAAAAELRLVELGPPLHDVDEPADLAQVPAAWLQAIDR